MVFQEERLVSWLWPLRQQGGKDGKDPCGEDGDDDSSDCERGFDIADSVEKGLARELVSEFMHPLRRSSKLWRFNVTRSDDKLQYRLFSDSGDFLMFARVQMAARQVDFFTYNPSNWDERLYDPSRPAFTMSWSRDKLEWRITQERCERCQFSPKHLSCSCHGKQQVAFIRQCKRKVGGGIFHCMEVTLPGLYSDGSRVVWCPLLGHGDLALPPGEDSSESISLETKRPSWNDEVESLVLDFKGRNITTSAKNFQLVLDHKPEHVICQFGKIGPMTFSLDLRYPMSVIQAFGTSLATLFWT